MTTLQKAARWKIPVSTTAIRYVHLGAPKARPSSECDLELGFENAQSGGCLPGWACFMQ